MRAYEYHPLSKITVKEKFLGNWSFVESIWVVSGLYLSSKMAELVPKLPISSDLFVLQYIHYALPLGICFILGFVEHRSGLGLLSYLASYMSYKRRKKRILDH